MKKAICIRDKKAKDGLSYNQIWCVFDRDSFSPQNFNAAFAIAENNKIQVAYSNEAFELWYLLHFNYYENAWPRKEYIKQLNRACSKKV